MASPWASTRRSARSLRSFFRRVACPSIWSNQRNGTLDISQPPVKLSTPAVRVDLWVLRRVDPTDVNLDMGHALSKMLVRPSASSFTMWETSTSDIDHASRKTLVHLLSSTCRLVGPLGAVIETLQRMEKSPWLASPSRGAQSPQISDSCYQVGRVRVDLFF